jgi:hypothetical protein
LHYSILKRIARDKNSSLLGPFVSLEENHKCWEYSPRVCMPKISFSS